MKKQIVTLLSFVGLLALTSCERKYTCVCVYPNSNISTTRTEFKAKKESDAEASCTQLNSAAQTSGGSCALE